MDKMLLSEIAKAIYTWFGDEDIAWEDAGEVTQDRFTGTAEFVIEKAEPLIRQETAKAVFEAIEQDFEDIDTIWQLTIAKFRWEALKKQLEGK